MGMLMSRAMDENMKKNQEAMKEMQEIMLERQIQMQNYMREAQAAMMVARSRDLFHYWATFYSLAVVGCVAGYRRTRRPPMLVPLLPLTFIVTYLGDAAYGNKLERIRSEASNILEDNKELVALPIALPSVEVLDKRREEAKKL